MKNIKIRLFKKDDAAQHNELYNIVFSGKRSIEQWHWKFEKYKNSLIIVAENEENKIVGAYSGIFSEVHHDNTIITSIQGVDNAILPEYRGQGIQRAMYDLWISELNKLNIAFYYGFTIKEHLKKGIKGLGYNEAGNIPFLTIRANRKRSNKDSIYQINRIERFDDRINKLYLKLKSKYCFSFSRNADFLNWRIFDTSNRKFTAFIAEENSELLGFIVLRQRQEGRKKIGYIFDLTCIDDKSVAFNLLNAANTHFLENGISRIKAYVPKHSYYYGIIKSYGFRRTFWKPFGFIVTPLENDYKEICSKVENWHVSLLDTDL